MSTGTARPDRHHGFPEELRRKPNWIAWRQEQRRNKKGEIKETKVPYNPITHKKAKSNDPSTWATLEQAQTALENSQLSQRPYHGLGFCLSGDLIGVDLDGCIVNGEFEPWAQEILDSLDSYTERSPSGTGAHIFVNGKLPPYRPGNRQYEFKDREHHGVGFYDAARGRYLATTGDTIRDAPIRKCTEELGRIHAHYFPPKAKPKPKAEPKAKPKPYGLLTDEELIQKARSAKNGAKFARLWDGNWSEYDSQSEADIALCMMLAFWTNRDAAGMDRLFRRSGLMRDKAEQREDYLERTIQKALDLQTETYGGFWKPPAPTITLAAEAIGPSLEMLNAVPLFHGRLRFESVSRRGSIIRVTTDKKQEILFPTMTDVTSFARARAAIAEGADILLPQPPRNQVGKIWDPIADLIVRLSAQDAVRVEHVLKAECRALLTLMWRYAKQPSAGDDSGRFMKLLVAISRAVRDRHQPAPPCVFTAEGFCWVHVPTFRNFLSLPSLTNRLYPLKDIHQGLLLLSFIYKKDVTRGESGVSASASLWRGPLDVLLE